MIIMMGSSKQILYNNRGVAFSRHHLLHIFTVLHVVRLMSNMLVHVITLLMSFEWDNFLAIVWKFMFFDWSGFKFWLRSYF